MTKLNELDRLLGDYGIIFNPDEGWYEDTIAEFKSAINSLTLKQVLELIGEDEPITFIPDCENCGEAGYGKIWWGRGSETGDAWGDRYAPVGETLLCQECLKEFRLGKEWNGQEIWKMTSDNTEHSERRINEITVRDEKAIARNALKAEQRKSAERIWS